MTFVPSTPNANDTIASTQPLIKANFTFLQGSLQSDHQFNDGVHPEGSHKQCKMLSQALSPSFPPPMVAGTDGVIFVHNGNAWFYDGSNNTQLSITPLLAGFSPFKFSASCASGVSVPIIILAPSTFISGNVGGQIVVWVDGLTNNLATFTFVSTGAGQRTVQTLANSVPSTIAVVWNGSGQLSLKNLSAPTITLDCFGWLYPSL